MRHTEIAHLATALALNAGNAALALAIAARLRAVAEDMAEAEQQPVPAGLREPEARPVPMLA